MLLVGNNSKWRIQVGGCFQFRLSLDLVDRSLFGQLVKFTQGICIRVKHCFYRLGLKKTTTTTKKAHKVLLLTQCFNPGWDIRPLEWYTCLLLVSEFEYHRFHFAGQYVFIEASAPRRPGDNAYLISQPFDPANSTSRCLKFWHHMKGASIGTLNIYIYTGNFSSMHLLWQRKGNKGNNWMFGQTPIGSNEKYQVKTTRFQ